MTREIIKIDINQIAEKEGHHTGVEISMEKVIEEDCIMWITIEMIIQETILGICKIIEVDTEGIIEMLIMEKVRVGLGTHNIQIKSVGIAEVVVIHVDQVQESVLIEIELDAISVGNMVILL